MSYLYKIILPHELSLSDDTGPKQAVVPHVDHEAQDTQGLYAVHHQWPDCCTIDRNVVSEVLGFPEYPDRFVDCDSQYGNRMKSIGVLADTEVLSQLGQGLVAAEQFSEVQA